jgi:hypothetical protein
MRMQVLIAGRNAKALATAAGAFADDLTIVTATTKAACIALLDGTEFDLIVACETLDDGSGLEVLSHAAVNTPDTLRIFAARASTLRLLKGELGLFGLFRTLTYPINFRKLWAALDLARSCSVESKPRTQTPTPGVRHVVLESEWPRGEPAAPQVQRRATGTPARRVANAATARTGAVLNNGNAAHTAGPSRQAQLRQAAQAHATPTAAQRTSSPALQTVRITAAVNGGAVAQPAGPSRQEQLRQAAQAHATPTAAQRTSSPAVQTVRVTAAVNGGTVAQAAGPSRQAQPRQAAQARAAPTGQRSPHAAAVRITATASSGTVTARAASVASARTGAAVNTGRATQAPGPSRQAQPQRAAAPSRQSQPRQVAASHATPASRRAAAAPRLDPRIAQSEAFKRALAKRNAAKLDANPHMSVVDVLGAVQQSRATAERGERRREPAMTNDSLAQLARLTTTRRPTYDSRSMSGGKKRAAIVVGSGVFAAGAAAVLTFFMLHTNNSIARSQLPLVASIERPVSQKSFPWQPTPQQPTSTGPVRSEVSGPAAADLEVQAEAASDASAVEPGHPGPPPPNPPPGPSEPPSSDSPGWVDE